MRALSNPSRASNSKNAESTPSWRAPAPGATGVAEPARGACAGPVGSPPPGVPTSSGTSSGYRTAPPTTGTVSFVASGPVKTLTCGSVANVGTLSGSAVVTRITSRWPARRWCAIAKPVGCMS